MATVAVFGVLAGGGAYAASRIGTRDIENGAVTAKKLHANAVTSEKIRSGQVGAKALGRIRERSAESAVIPPGGTSSKAVQCHAGEQVVSGGTDFSTSSGLDVTVLSSRFQRPNGWASILTNESATATATLTTHAYCLAR